MDYEWDPAKAELNVRKHGVGFAFAVDVLEGDDAAILLEQSQTEEDRLVAIGRTATDQLLVVVFIYRDIDRIRIISARPATPAEQRQYREKP